ncbi:hypothetical protein [Vreelandella maris]|uniref:hypothetical protein n=1 Tax=Vreelandella maris TaxID=2729617 RepID=UPI0030ED2255|tara:strand:+ start:310 stop:540 length:231 start_codon:yes stop_codon:yes gene_type:complete
MANGDAFWRNVERRSDLKKAENDGRVADSMEVRKSLMAKVDSGEITLQEAQSELKRIKRNAKKNGQVTRNQAFLGR